MDVDDGAADEDEVRSQPQIQQAKNRQNLATAFELALITHPDPGSDLVKLANLVRNVHCSGEGCI